MFSDLTYNKKGYVTRKNGNKACRISGDEKRYKIWYNGYMYFSHRVIWIMHYGEIPKGMEIDHIDRNPKNNKIENLRLVSPSQNKMNRAKAKKTKLLPKGVRLIKKTKRYQARISIDSKLKSLGCYDTIKEASDAYDNAAKWYFKEFAALNNYSK